MSQELLVTNDLGRFGFRELGIAAELLEAWSNNRFVDGCVLNDDAKPAIWFNLNSGEVFLSDDDCNVVALNGDGKLENWVEYEETGEEMFASEAEARQKLKSQRPCDSKA